MRISRPVSIALFIIMVTACRADKTQNSAAWVEGSIINFHNDRFVANAAVALNDSLYTVKTDSAGHFKFDSIPSGTYNLSVTADGYQNITIKNITFLDSQQYILNFRLKEDWLITEKQSVTDYAVTAERNQVYVPGAALNLIREPYQSNLIARLEEPVSILSAIERNRYLLSSANIGGRGNPFGTSGASAGIGCFRYVPYNRWWWSGMFDIRFKKYQPYDFVKTADNPYSTFGADVSTAAYTLVKNYITKNQTLPPPDAVRTEELINYFDLKYPSSQNRAFGVHTRAQHSVIDKKSYLMQIGIQARTLSAEERIPLQIIYVVDVSGSMSWDSRYRLVLHALETLTKQAGPGDKIGIVTYGTGAKVILEPIADQDSVLAVIRRLSFNEDYTNAEAGLVKAYELLGARYDPKAMNHVILCTDGVANKGQTASSAILKQIENQRQKGVYLSACGFGMNTYNDAGLEELATQGDGIYYYIASEEDGERIFVKQFLSTTQVIARDVAIQAEFDPNVVSEYRLLGYEKREMKTEQFGQVNSRGGEIGSGHHVTVLYELRLKDTTARSAGFLTLRYRSPDKKDTFQHRDSLLLCGFSNREDEDAYRFISAVVLFAELLKESPWVRDRSFTVVKDLLKQTDTSFRRQCLYYEDFAELVRQAIQIESYMNRNKQLAAFLR